MSEIHQKAIRSLEVLDATRPLVQLVDDIVRDYPDPYALSSRHAAQLLRKHTGREMDPRFVWWNQFNS